MTGEGSLWEITEDLMIGPQGGSELLIEAGGVINSDSASIGYTYGPYTYTGKTTTVTVTGAGSQLNNERGLGVGYLGPAILNILDGGEVNTGYISMGTPPESNSVIHFDNGTLNTQNLSVGARQLTGVGTINAESIYSDVDLVYDSNQGYNQTIRLNEGPGQDITINLSTPASPSTLLIGAGYLGAGSISVSGGFTLESSSGLLGYRENSHGVATVSGPGTEWRLSSQLVVGQNGEGMLAVQGGGLVDLSSNMYVGSGSVSNGDAQGTVVVDGAGSEVNLSNVLNVLYVGNYGQGSVRVQNSGLITTGSINIGNESGSFGEVTVTGPGSALDCRSYVNVGVEGQGELHITSGGRLTSLYGFVGIDGDGTVTVSGAGSSWEMSADLRLSEYGSAALLIEDGGFVSNVDGRIGRLRAGSVVVTGPGSTWINTGTLEVGSGGQGTLSIFNGGAVQSQTAEVGYACCGDRSVLVAGAGSAWHNLGALRIGRGSGLASVTVMDGGEISVGGDIMMAEYETSNAVIDIQGGVFNLGGNVIRAGEGSAQIILSGGKLLGADTIQIGSDFTQTGGTLAPGQSGGQTLIVGGYNLTGGTLELEVGDAAPYQIDRLITTANIDINPTGTTLALPTIGPISAGLYPVIYSSEGALTGQFEHITGISIYPGLVDVTYTESTLWISINWDYVPGDLNADGFVGLDDLDTLLLNWNQTVGVADLSSGDISGDGYVGLDDLDVLLNNWNAGMPPANASKLIPEPGMPTVATLGLMVLVNRRKH